MGWETIGAFVGRVIKSEQAASLIEWGLLVVLVAVVTLIAISFAGDQNSEMWSDIASSLDK